MNDAELLLLYAARDETAIEQTAAVYGDSLLRFAQRILHNAEDAEECVNDTYRKVWDAVPTVAQPQNLRAYLFQTCRFEAFGKLDKQHAAKRSAELVALTEELSACLPHTSVEDTFAAKELEEALRRFLETLPQDKRMIFLRRYWFGESIGDIAGRYRVSEGKVKTSLHRTRNTLRQYLKKEGLP